MYNQKIVRELFEKWGHEEIVGDPGTTTSSWVVPHINHMILERWLPQEGTALDAGCGCGIESVKMARLGLKVTAIDISTSLLSHAQKRTERAGLGNAITFIQADITESLLLPYNHFDVCIALTGVISHTGSRHRDAIRNVVTCAKPGGLIIFGVDSYYGKIHQYLIMGLLDEAEHVADTKFTSTVSGTFEDYCFTPQELKDILENLNCHIITMFSAPTIGISGYSGCQEGALCHALSLEQRFLGAPELLGIGEQLIVVCEKTTEDRS